MQHQLLLQREDELALYIRTLAREQEIPMVENRPLARSLYYQVEEDGDDSRRFIRSCN